MTRRSSHSVLLALSALVMLMYLDSIKVASNLCGAQRAFGASCKASNPDPPDGAEGVTKPLLSWTAAEVAKWHDVYFGTNPTPGDAEFIGHYPMTMTVYYHAPGLNPGTTYYW